MDFIIKNRWSLDVKFECELEASLEAESYGVQLGAAIKAAYKDGAVLTDAVLTDAVLTDAVLTGADLRGAVLTRADLRGADLTRADLTGADLTRADLTGAVLTRADLTRADLRGADLRGADLRGADLTGTKNDFFNVLLHAPHEVEALAEALRSGKVNGSTYEGSCACLVVTIANARKCSYKEVPGPAPDFNRPAERWFLAIRTGDTPESSLIVRITMKWIKEFQELMVAASRSKLQS